MTVPFLPQCAGLISMFNMGPLRLNRPGQPSLNAYGAFDDARAHEHELDPVHVQTMTGRDLESEPGIDAHKETIILFTIQRLYVSDDGEVADLVEYHDRCYRVVKVEDYDPHGGVYASLAQIQDGTFPEEHT